MSHNSVSGTARIRRRGRQATAALALLAAVCAGCGSEEGLPRAPVAGSVSVDGQALPNGVIRFIPMAPTKGPAAVAAVKDGKFQLSREEGPLVGSLRVEIEASEYQGFAVDDERAFAARASANIPMPRNPIPPAFNQDSTLTAQLAPEGNPNLNFQIQTKLPALRR